MHVHANDAVISQSNSRCTLHLRYGWDPPTKVIACTTRVMCAKEFVIEWCYIFHIIANVGFWLLVMTGPVLLMSPRGRNASRDGFVKLWEGGFYYLQYYCFAK